MYVYSGAHTVSLNSASQGLVDLGSKWRKVVVQANLATNPGYGVYVQPTKASASQAFSTASQTKWANALSVTTATGAFANQPAGDTLHIASDSAADTSQTATIYATTAAGGTVKAYSAKLDGTTRVNIGSTAPYDYRGDAASGNFQTVLGIELSAACAGTITLEEASGNADIKTIAAGTTSVGVTNIDWWNQDAYGLPVRIVAGGASTKIVGVYGEPVVGDGTAGEEVTLSGATNVYTTRCYSRIKKLLWGDVADSTTVSFGQYGIIIGSGGPARLTADGTEAGPELTLTNCRYLAWAVYNGTTLSNGGAADRLLLTLYG